MISSQTGLSVDPRDADGLRDLYNFQISSEITSRVTDEIIVITSNDSYRLLLSADCYIEALQATHIIVPDRGHFNSSYGDGHINDTLPELLEFL